MRAMWGLRLRAALRALALLLSDWRVRAASGAERLGVLFENIGSEQLELELFVPNGPRRKIGPMEPRQGGKLGASRGERYRINAKGKDSAMVEIEDEGHVRCWVDKGEVRVYPIWGKEVLQEDETAQPDPAIARHDKWEVVFQNRCAGPITFSRVSASGERKELGTLPSQKGKRLRLYWGQRIQASSEGRAPAEVRVQGKGTVRFTDGGEAGAAELKAEASWEPVEGPGLLQPWLVRAAEIRDECERSLARLPADAKFFCDGRHDARAHVWGAFARAAPELESWRRARRKETDQREAAMREQPARLKHFTARGHAVRPVPASVMKPLRRLWRERRLKDAVPEPHSSEVLAESDTWMLYVDDEVLEAIHQGLTAEVEAWAGLREGDLVRTDAYGARLYRHGSKLHMHVDSGLRAALSVIIHVGHLGWGKEPEADEESPEAEAWPLHILDHEGVEHQVRTKAGEMILYESAVCAHGRPTAFEGREYANVFLHYNPHGWPRAFEHSAQREEL